MLSALPPTLVAILQGQFISLLIAGTGVFASLLSDSTPNANFPLFMNFCNYSLLSLFLLRRCAPCAPAEGEGAGLLLVVDDSQHGEPLQLPAAPPRWWWYLLTAVLDVQANYLVLLAYNYTTLTSVMLLDCFTIPITMALSYTLLRCRYTPRHLAGAAVCLVGLAVIVSTDSTDDEHADDPLRGDLLCLGGALLYAASNVLQEYLVKQDRDAFRGALGGYGMLIAGAQCLLVDLPHMHPEAFTTETVLAMVGFVVCLFLMYVNTSAFLTSSDATLFNLSLLSSDCYAVLYTYLAEGYLVRWTYFLALALVIVGLAVYHTERAPGHWEEDRERASSGTGGQKERNMSISSSSRFEYNPIGGREDDYSTADSVA